MKIILSRKGFDSSAGGHASPVLPDGTMLSLPIPSRLDTLAYGDVSCAAGCSVGELIRRLGAGAKIAGCGAHLDPDLVRTARPRTRGWTPSLGQMGAAATHLRNQRVGVGDLFLFYGWFRRTERIGGTLRFAGPRAGFHALFGYLQIGAIVSAHTRTRLPRWLRDHPHAHPARRSCESNTIYVASRAFSGDTALPGAGTLRFDASRVLSAPGRPRSRWRLDPALFGAATISYHDDDAWRDGYFQSCARGQEYVVDADGRIEEWARQIVRRGAAKPARP